MDDLLDTVVVIGERQCRISGLLGEGGMARVYAAISDTGQQVAVKVLIRPGDAEYAVRFNREGALLKQLSHRALPKFLGRGAVGSTFYVAMELINGMSLAEYIRSQPGGCLSPHRALAIFADVLRFAQWLFEGPQLLHRDWKSSNIMIDADGSIRVLDLGVAGRMRDPEEEEQASPRLTIHGAVMGTMDYLAPRLLLGESASPRSELHALGVLLFEMVTGRLPCSHVSDLAELRRALTFGDWKDLHSPHPELNTLVARLMSRETVLRRNPAEEAAAAPRLVLPSFASFVEALAAVLDVAASVQAEVDESLARAELDTLPAIDVSLPAPEARPLGRVIREAFLYAACFMLFLLTGAAVVIMSPLGP